jgi:hypothetical protein
MLGCNGARLASSSLPGVLVGERRRVVMHHKRRTERKSCC